MPIYLSPNEAREFLGLSDTAWGRFVNMGIISKVPYTDNLYDKRELLQATEKARHHAQNDNTISLKAVHGKQKSKPKPTKSKAASGGAEARINRLYDQGAAGESR